ncbi:hypothetical protein C3B48_03680 [Flavobacterium columnare]|uniref:hypothetical protein n=1 Tax=Flavobacterium columnare TaxID=996 RepID=UPI001896711F|nr:hypothetical protein [Flavobacterium columnare]MBF6654766.1 hypothetical protein [Flavobacterium columnare]
MKKINTLDSDCTTYSKEFYENTELSLAERINLIIREAEEKYEIQPVMELLDGGRRVKIEILNKTIHNLF